MAQLPEPVASVASIRRYWPGRPEWGIILGTGADEVARNIAVEATIPYDELPGFPRSTALGHKGQFVIGQYSGKPVIAMQGRFHLYEGYRASEVRLPLALMHQLGVHSLLISNAAGGVNPRMASGDLMVLHSHLDLMFRAWPAPSATATTPGRPRRSDIYDRQLIDRCVAFARRRGFTLHRGVYAGLIGPNYETRAEYRFLRRVGADVVGMSTIPEVVVAADLGLRVMAVSLVANVARPDVLQPTSGQEVIDAAARAAPRLAELFAHAIASD